MTYPAQQTLGEGERFVNVGGSVTDFGWLVAVGMAFGPEVGLKRLLLRYAPIEKL